MDTLKHQNSEAPVFGSRLYNGLAGGDYEAFSEWVDMGLGKVCRLPMLPNGGGVLLKNGEPVGVMFGHAAPADGVMFLDGLYAPRSEWLSSGSLLLESALHFYSEGAVEMGLTEIRAWVPGGMLSYLQRCGFVLDCPMSTQDAQQVSGLVPVRASVAYFTNLFSKPWKQFQKAD